MRIALGAAALGLVLAGCGSGSSAPAAPQLPSNTVCGAQCDRGRRRRRTPPRDRYLCRSACRSPSLTPRESCRGRSLSRRSPWTHHAPPFTVRSIRRRVTTWESIPPSRPVQTLTSMDSAPQTGTTSTSSGRTVSHKQLTRRQVRVTRMRRPTGSTRCNRTASIRALLSASLRRGDNL